MILCTSIMFFKRILKRRKKKTFVGTIIRVNGRMFVLSRVASFKNAVVFLEITVAWYLTATRTSFRKMD